ncbi:TolC family protein [Melioribacter sp. OK-6-Me]|uniref:TolC family protein n=1 Tax=unclassified Melioribacter TaxID=2627329 RepID=UPI003ED86BBC
MHRVMCIVFVLFSLLSLSTNGQTSGKLTIEKAVSLAVQNNPELKTLHYEIDALGAAKIQSGLMPNPEFEVEAENILGSKDFNGFDNSEITAVLSQDILLAGKISKRVKVAETNISLAEWDYETKRIEIITDIRKAFQQALAVQLLIEKNEELIKVSKEFVVNLQKRVDDGKISPAEVSRAKIILNSLRIDLNRLKSEYENYKSELLSLIYQPDLTIDELIGELEYPVDVPSYDSLLNQLTNNPKLKRYESEYDKQTAIVNLEESKAVPDLTISVGFKRLNDAKANTFLVGASIPLLIFDRNQGAIQEAKIRVDQKQREYFSVKNRLTLQLNVLYKRLNTLIETAAQLKSESIPEAEDAFQIIKEGNLVGRFAIIDVLDAERTLFELQNQYLNIIGQIHSTQIEIEGLIAKEIN